MKNVTKRLTIRRAQEEVESLLKERGWLMKDRLGRYYSLAHCMEELGEVSRCITNLESKRKEIKGRTKDELMEELELEIGDLMYHVFKLGCVYDIDVNDAFTKTMKKINKKFPIERFKRFKQF